MRANTETISRLTTALREAQADHAWLLEQHERNRRREVIQRELVSFLNDFFSGKVALPEFRETFDRKTRKEWDGFGLKGMSGAMFLNKLVKHVPDHASLTDKLKETLVAPRHAEEARTRVSALLLYLRDVILNQGIAKDKIDPGRSTFFLSAMWHMQDRETWPVYYTSARSVFKDERIFNESGEPISDYLNFRETWIDLQRDLSLTTWDFENLCSRLSRGIGNVVQPVPSISEDEVDDSKESTGTAVVELPQHTEVQWMLAKLGQKLNYRIWIAANDRSRSWNNEKLSAFSLSTLPNLGIGNDAQKIISLIDVLWLKGNHQVVAAFEVESTTSIYSGLLRMSDLVINCPNLTFDCYIAVPEDRSADVVRQLSRPTFQYLELHKKCRFFTYEDLKRELQSIMRWAEDASSMRKLSTAVDDVE